MSLLPPFCCHEDRERNGEREALYGRSFSDCTLEMLVLLLLSLKGEEIGSSYCGCLLWTRWCLTKIPFSTSPNNLSIFKDVSVLFTSLRLYINIYIYKRLHWVCSKTIFPDIPSSNICRENLGQNLRGEQAGLRSYFCVLWANVQVLYEIGQKADTTLNLKRPSFTFFFFHYQGAKGDRGTTGDAGEKGEQVKIEYAFQQYHHCHSFFINSCYNAGRGTRDRRGRWELSIAAKPQMDFPSPLQQNISLSCFGGFPNDSQMILTSILDTFGSLE